MRKLHVAAFISLDGVVQAPGGEDEDREGGFAHGGWVFPLFDEGVGQAVDQVFAGPPALLLGRKTYDIFAGYWPHQSDDMANLLNGMTKYVATRSPGPLDWNDSHAIGPDAVAAVRQLKAKPGPDLLTQGSSDLIQSLLAADLVDRFTLMIFPVVIGDGKRLFGFGATPAGMKLVDATTTSTGVIVARFERDGPLRTQTFTPEEHA